MSISVAQGAASGETADVGRMAVPQTMGIRSGRVKLLVDGLPCKTIDARSTGVRIVVVERVCWGDDLSVARRIARACLMARVECCGRNERVESWLCSRVVVARRDARRIGACQSLGQKLELGW